MNLGSKIMKWLASHDILNVLKTLRSLSGICFNCLLLAVKLKVFFSQDEDESQDEGSAVSDYITAIAQYVVCTTIQVLQTFISELTLYTTW